MARAFFVGLKSNHEIAKTRVGDFNAQEASKRLIPRSQSQISGLRARGLGVAPAGAVTEHGAENGSRGTRGQDTGALFDQFIAKIHEIKGRGAKGRFHHKKVAVLSAKRQKNAVHKLHLGVAAAGPTPKFVEHVAHQDKIKTTAELSREFVELAYVAQIRPVSDDLACGRHDGHEVFAERKGAAAAIHEVNFLRELSSFTHAPEEV